MNTNKPLKQVNAHSFIQTLFTANNVMIKGFYSQKYAGF